MRDENGRFVPGQSGNPKGRSPRRTEDEYLNAMISRVTLKDWREVVDKALLQAKRGDSMARQWLTNYIVGPPIQKLQHTGADNGPIEQTFRVIFGEIGSTPPTDSTTTGDYCEPGQA